MARKPHPCYLCGKPCYNKGCRECLTKGKHSGLAKYYNERRKQYAHSIQQE
jgi:hypothetical protein